MGRYRFQNGDDGDVCAACNAGGGKTYTLDELVEQGLVPPLHKNCRCKIVAEDSTKQPASREKSYKNRLEGQIRIQEDIAAGDNVKYNETPTKKQLEQARTFGGGVGAAKIEDEWYDPLLRIPEDALEMWEELSEAQYERFKNIKNPIDALDWLTYGWITAGMQRSDKMLEEPSLYNIGNWLTMGLFDTIKRTFNPEEPLSLQHWLDSLGTAGTVIALYELYQYRTNINNPENVIEKTHLENQGRRAGDIADDALDDAIEGKVELKIVDGKVGGKVPVEDYNAIRSTSVKNPDAKSLTLGKFDDGGPTSYIAKAGKDSSYFDMGSDWGNIKKQYGLSNNEMFEYFNKPVLDEALSNGNTIRFSHNPLFDDGFLGMEWDHIKSIAGLNDSNLIFEGGFWIVR